MKKENKSLERLYHPDDFKKIGKQLVEDISLYLEQCYNQNIPINNYVLPKDLTRDWDDFLSTDPDLNSFFRKILGDSIHLHNPAYMGHQVSVPSPFGALGGLVSDILNNGMAVYEMGAAANILEIKCIDLIKEKMGFGEKAGGFLTSGGTLANLTALLTARSMVVEEDIWNESYSKKYAIMVSDQAHYSVERAVKIMGLGSEGLIKLPVNDKFQVDIVKARQIFNVKRTQGIEIFALIGSACSTATGSYDKLNEIADLAEEKGIWFHVDGAHGAAVVFSDLYKNLVSGIHRADSVILDIHKMMMSPTLATAVIYKNQLHGLNTFNQKAEYLYNATEDLQWFDSGKRTFECTKLMMAVKFMAMYLRSGSSGFQENVDQLYTITKKFAQTLEGDKEIELLLSPQANILCFRFINERLNEEKSNRCNQFIRESILHQGRFYIVQTSIHGKHYLRTAIMNPYTTEEIFEALVKQIKYLGNQFLLDLFPPDQEGH